MEKMKVEEKMVVGEVDGEMVAKKDDIHIGDRFDIDLYIWNELVLAVRGLKSFRPYNPIAYNRDD